MKPALLADWDLQHVLAQLNHAKVKHSGCAAQDSQHKGVFKENPDPANISEYATPPFFHCVVVTFGQVPHRHIRPPATHPP